MIASIIYQKKIKNRSFLSRQLKNSVDFLSAIKDNLQGCNTKVKGLLYNTLAKYFLISRFYHGKRFKNTQCGSRP